MTRTLAETRHETLEYSGVMCSMALAILLCLQFGSWRLLAVVPCTFFFLKLFWRYGFILVMFCFLISTSPLLMASDVSVLRWPMLGFSAFVGLAWWFEDRSIRFGMIHVGLIAVSAMQFASLWISLNPLITLLKALSFAVLLMYALTAGRLCFVNHESVMISRLRTFAAICVAVLLAAKFGLDLDVLGNPNNLGLACSVLFFSPLLVAAVSSDRNRIFYWTLTLGSVFLVWSSRSRASLLAVGAASIVIAISFAFKRKTFLLLCFALCVLAFIFFSLYRADLVEGVANEIMAKNEIRGSLLDSRADLWGAEIDSIRHHPLFGIGHGVGEMDGSKDFTLIDAMIDSSATNEKGSSWLGLVEELGIVGSIPALIILAAVMWRVFRVMFGRYPSRHPEITITLAGIMVAGMADASFESWLFAVGSYACFVYWCFLLWFFDASDLNDPSRPSLSPIALGKNA